jgi:hypothetical protein
MTDQPTNRNLVAKRPADTLEQRLENQLANCRELAGAVHIIRETVEEYGKPGDLADSERFGTAIEEAQAIAMAVAL